ncbi:MAG TPA: hypothetical protein VK543_00105 [Puia sp.]|nr:hypothetical protein [Puia sp.]
MPKKPIKKKKADPRTTKRLHLSNVEPVKLNISFEEAIKLAANTPSPYKNINRTDDNDPNLSTHPGFVDVLKASIDALPAVEKRNKKIKKQIIKAIKNGDDYQYSDNGQTTTLLELLKSLPSLNVMDLQSAIIDMEDVVVKSDSETAAIKFPASYFK